MAARIGFMETQRSIARCGLTGECVVIRDDNYTLRRFTNGRSQNFGERKWVIPEVGERSPETGSVALVSAWVHRELGRKFNKKKEILRSEMLGALARRVH
jgi:hypothetical protein